MSGYTKETAKAAVAYLKEQRLQMSFRWRFPEESPPSQDVEALLAENLSGLKYLVEGAAFETVDEKIHEIVAEYGLKDWFLREYPPDFSED